MEGYLILGVMVFLAAAWWFFGLIRPVIQNLRWAEPIPIFAYLFVVSELVTLFFVAYILGGTDALIASIFPPLGAIIAVYIAIQLNLFSLLVSLVILGVLSFPILYLLQGKFRLFGTPIIALTLFIVPLAIQNTITAHTITAEFERLEGNCLSSKSFFSSIFDARDSSQYFHAVIIRGESAFFWSYHNDAFIELSDATMANSLLRLAPDDSCKSTP